MPFAATAVMAQNMDDAPKYASMITKEALKAKLSVIASAEMEGRETASPGQKRAAAYIEGLFRKYGLKPGNGDSYQQTYAVSRDNLVAKKLMVNGRTFEWDKDYAFNMDNIPNGITTFNNLVFAGYGVVDPDNKINDLAGLNVSGKLVVVLDGTGAPAAPQQGRRGFGGPGSAAAKAQAARLAGAAGLIVVSPNLPARFPSALSRMSIPWSANRNTPFFSITVSDEVASAMLGRTSKLTADQLKSTNKGNYVSEVTVDITKTHEDLESSNVVGVLPGTDKSDEYLFLTGHYDHLGKDKNGVIYYGADDDGSGTTTVLQMAEAFAAAAKKGYRPRRNIVFMTVSGEEKGLWGSEYYSEHPLFPLEKTTADLNTDMDGRVDTERKLGDTLNYTYVIGHDKLSSDLAKINEDMNNRYTHLTLDYMFDDPKDPNNIYYRSDHYNFAKKGVPILFFYDGMLKADYHKPTDTVDKINFDLMQKRAQLVFYTAWNMANRDDMLKRDMKLNMPTR